jgi:hypothetical protein
MLTPYFVNRDPHSTGEHEVHEGGCSKLPKPKSRLYLGDYPSCHDAMKAAKLHYASVDGCVYCCFACHTRQGVG